jgi:O-antigen/teichoic acid export membrane protein
MSLNPHEASSSPQSTGPGSHDFELEDMREPAERPPLTSKGSRGIFSRLTTSLAEARSLSRRFGSIVRLKPFDTSTPEGRSNERYRRAALTTAMSIVARVLGIFTGLAWIRLSISYLGKERYGLWMAVGSLVAWANLADFGLARGMQNHLSQANGQDDRALAGRYVSTGLATLTGAALLFALISAPFVVLLPWTSILNVTNPALTHETRQVVAVVLACFLIQFPLSIVPTIYAAYQRGYVAAIFNILGSVLSLTSLVFVTRAELSLPWLVLITSGTGIVLTIANLGFVLREMPWLRPKLSLVSMQTLRALAGTSVALFVFQIGSLLINETQNVIIARRLGLSHVADWSVFMRVHLLPFIFISMIDAPLIPAFRESHVRGEHQWLRTAFWRVTKLKLVIAAVSVVLLLTLGNTVAGLIGGSGISFTWKMWAASGFLLLVAVWNSSFNDLMIAADRLRLLVITVLINGLVTITLSYTIAPYLGLVGVVFATAAFSFLISGWLLPWACRDLVKAPPLPAPATAQEG